MKRGIAVSEARNRRRAAGSLRKERIDTELTKRKRQGEDRELE